MFGCVGAGVAMPLDGLVGDGVGVGVVVVFVEVVNVVLVGVVMGVVVFEVVVEVVVVMGAPALTSTQYDWPTFMPAQAAESDGFIWTNSSTVIQLYSAMDSHDSAPLLSYHHTQLGVVLGSKG
jgi:hypothetical protein